MISRGIEFGLGADREVKIAAIRDVLIAMGRSQEEAEKEAQKIVGRMKTQQEIAGVVPKSAAE